MGKPIVRDLGTFFDLRSSRSLYTRGLAFSLALDTRAKTDKLGPEFICFSISRLVVCEHGKYKHLINQKLKLLFRIISI